jgi:hypothetical protein
MAIEFTVRKHLHSYEVAIDFRIDHRGSYYRGSRTYLLSLTLSKFSCRYAFDIVHFTFNPFAFRPTLSALRIIYCNWLSC